MTSTIFIDGEAGTTGLQIRERLAGRTDLELILLGDDKRKDLAARKDALNAADVAILCLPDDAARESVALIENTTTRVIDASTAHRTAEGWAYGFAEMAPDQHQKIADARFVTNPGCYPQGFIASVRPLVEAGLIPADFPLTYNAISGYSGGGKAMIADYEGSEKQPAFLPYGLTLKHKHLPEMQVNTAIGHAPVFQPAVGTYAQGMVGVVPLQSWALPKKPSAADLHAAIANHFADAHFVEVMPLADFERSKDVTPEVLNNTNRMQLYVFGNDQTGQALLVSVYDNLGKGASGAAVQNLNIMLGLPETSGLE